MKRQIETRRCGAEPRLRHRGVPPSAWALVLTSSLALLAAYGGEPAGSGNGATVIEDVAAEYTRLLEETTALGPYGQLRRGETVTTFPDSTPEIAHQIAASAQTLLDRLGAVDEDEISHEDWISLELLRWNLQLVTDAADHYWATIEISPYAVSGVLGIYHQIFAAAPLATDADRENYLHLMREYRDAIGQLADKVAGQKERSIYMPKAQVPNVVAMYGAYKGGLDGIFVPQGERLGDAPGDFEGQIQEVLAQEIAPAYDRLLSLLGEDYVAAAPTEVGLSMVPGGSALYRHLVRQHSTTNFTAEEIHQIGLDEVARLEAEMAAIREELGFEGRSPETAMKDFLDEIRADPRFIAKTPEEVEERYMGYVALMEPHVGDYFSVVPEAPYGVRRLDEANEATMTFGVYEPPTASKPRGEYRYNGSDLENRSLFSAQGLIYHELIPGHHFQLALAYEREDLPTFRRESTAYTAYTEGWAEYAANLGKEMGLYSDPYDLYGRLVMEMFVSCRLVVDTGMNHLGWDIEQAREFMAARIVYSDVEIATELMRYSADIHGQALGYRMGYLEIARLRRKAEEALGNSFDIRRFHAAVIGSGAMPMVVLEKHIDWWIDQEKAGEETAS